MMLSREELLDAVSNLILEVQSLRDDPDDRQRFGSGLQALAGRVDEHLVIRELLQVLGQRVADAAMHLLEFVPLCTRALNAIERFLMDDPAGMDLIDTVRDELGPEGKLPAVSGPSLDTLALQLVQCEPDDAKGLKALAAACRAYAGVHDNAAGTASAGAAEILEKAGRSKSDRNRLKALEEAGVLIEAAQDALEQIEAEAVTVGPDGAGPVCADEEDGEDAPTQAARSAEAVPEKTAEPAEGTLPADTDLDIVGKFVIETRDLLEGAEAALLALEANPGDKEAVNTVFRAFHTVKGSASYLGIPYMAVLAHDAESVLARIREGELPYTSTIADIALRSVDMIKHLLAALQETLSSHTPIPKPDGFDHLLGVLSDPDAGVPDRRASIPNAPAGIPAADDQLHEHKQAAESSVRVRTSRLDQLVDMVGELVIAQAMVAQDEVVTGNGHYGFQRKVTHAGKIVRDLQDLSLSMRMVPLKSTFQRMTRLVRDLAHKSGKEILFETAGEDTEIDRNMVDIVNDPLVHLLRNAVDHGIESGVERSRRGKAPSGRIRLSAENAGGNIIVTVSDDGAGLDRDAILRKAQGMNLVAAGENPSEREICNLIFAPGFSTAREVTDISGRGVGLDVVKEGVEALRGSIEIETASGQGTAFAMRLPLTLAITDGMLLRAGSQRYIIPTVNISESLRVGEREIATVAGRGEMLCFREEMLPFVRLYRLFGVADAQSDPEKGLVVVVQETNRRFAILVDELQAQMQVVIKALGEGLGRVEGVSGGAILGDGSVGLILDLAGIWDIVRKRNSSGLSLEQRR